MNLKKIVIAGGTGFIGQYLQQQFRQEGYEVQLISRKQGDVSWDDKEGIVLALEGAELLINLAGKSVDCRYNETNKKEILQSRTETTKILGEAITQCKLPPPLWLNSSTATIYRHAEDRPMTESGGDIGAGFSVSVAKAWEEMFFSFSLPRTRRVALRIAIVLGSGGGVMIPYTSMVKYGMGGRQGNGRQMFSWIHVKDLYRIIRFLQLQEEIEGAVNCAAPHPVPNRVFMKTLRKVMKNPFGLPVPVWLLKAGARMIGTETELVLKSRWVLPERLMASGFSFTFPDIETTLKDILE